MNAEKQLEYVKMLDELINAKLAEREQLMALATDASPRPMDGMPFDGSDMSSSKVENAVVKMVDLAREIDRLIDQYIDHKKKIISLLEKLPEKEYGVLHRYYIRYMTWEKVAEDMGYCASQIWRIKKKALENFEKILKCN